MTTPTANPVPSSAPEDLLFNAEKLDEAVNGGAATFLDRKGVARMTLAGALSTIAQRINRGTWVTATAYSMGDLAQQSGTWYLALINHISGTFATDLSAGRWMIYQAPTSAGDVGFDGTLNYALATLGRHAVDADGPCVTDFPWLVDPTQNAAYNTPRMQAALTWAATNRKRVTLPFNAQIRLNATLTAANTFGMGFGGKQPRGAKSVCTFVWDGAAGGTVLDIDRVRESEFEGFRIIAGTAVPGVGIELDQRAGTGAELSTGNVFRNVSVRGPDTVTRITSGIHIARTSTSNNDLHTFDHCATEYCTDGVVIGHSQSKYNTFNRHNFGFCATGLRCTAGSFTLYTPNFSNNTLDIFYGAPGDCCTTVNAQSEGAARLIATSGQTSAAAAVVYLGGRFSPDAVHADGEWIKFDRPGPLSMIGAQMHGGVQVAHARAVLGVNAFRSMAAVFRGCGFPNPNFISTTQPNAEVSAEACLALDVAGIAHPYTFDKTMASGATINVARYLQRFSQRADNAADNTAAIHAAIADCPPGGRVYFPAPPAGGRYVISAFPATSKSITLCGDGWWNRSNTAFGHADYLNTANAGGSVIRVTGTTGNALSLVGSGSVEQYQMEGLLLIGPGTGDSVGIALGSATQAVVQSSFRRVGVMNFATGMTGRNAYECFINVLFRGCQKGLHAPFVVGVGQSFNNNVIQSFFECAGGIGSLFETGAGCDLSGSLWQNCASGLELKPGAPGAIEAFTVGPGSWMENQGGVHWTIDTTNGAVKNVKFDSVRGSGTATISWISPQTSADVSFINCAFPGAALVVPNGAVGGRADRESNFASITNNSATFVVEDQEPRTIAHAQIDGTAGTITFSKGLTFVKNAAGNYTFTFNKQRTTANYTIAPVPLYTGTGNLNASWLNKGQASFDVRISNGATLVDTQLLVTVTE